MANITDDITFNTYRKWRDDYLQRERVYGLNSKQPLNPEDKGIVEGFYILARQILGIPHMQESLTNNGIPLEEVEGLTARIRGFAKSHDVTLPDRIPNMK